MVQFFAHLPQYINPCNTNGFSLGNIDSADSWPRYWLLKAQKMFLLDSLLQ